MKTKKLSEIPLNEWVEIEDGFGGLFVNKDQYGFIISVEIADDPFSVGAYVVNEEIPALIKFLSE